MTISMTFKKRDGTIVQESSPCSCDPDARKRAHQCENKATSWYKINRGPWRKVRSGAAFVKAVYQAKSCHHFVWIYEK